MTNNIFNILPQDVLFILGENLSSDNKTANTILNSPDLPEEMKKDLQKRIQAIKTIEKFYYNKKLPPMENYDFWESRYTNKSPELISKLTKRMYIVFYPKEHMVNQIKQISNFMIENRGLTLQEKQNIEKYPIMKQWHTIIGLASIETLAYCGW